MFSLRANYTYGSRSLATYSYTTDQNRYLQAIDYGNGDGIEYEYDNQGRLISQTWEDGATVTYQYDNNGALAIVTDSATGTKISYYYDFSDRLMKYTKEGVNYSHSVEYTYDNLNNMTKLIETVNGVAHETGYSYDEDNRLVGIDYGAVSESITYDAYGRLNSSSVQNASGKGTQTTYQYKNPSSTTTSTQLLSVTVAGDTEYLRACYSYDDNGNIVNYRVIGPESMGGIIPWTNGEVILEEVYYYYDSANQLIREDNVRTNKTKVWTYDDAGNITSVQHHVYTTWGTIDADFAESITAYTYGDSAWGDLLTAYNGKTITYDAIGNPLSDGTWTYTWRNGRELASMTSGSTTWSYTYDADGMRMSRSNGSTTYNYVYNGSQLVQMTKGTDTLYFAYGSAGPATVTWNGTTYYYALNGQGDVIAIFDGNGDCVVTYYYDDAWGYNPHPTGSLASTLGTLNPLRYRSYVYDQETGLYYLQSRYYNPEVGRFLNADAFASTGQGLLGNNMFAYCLNNPVNCFDPSGTATFFVRNGDRNPLFAGYIGLGGGVAGSGGGATRMLLILKIYGIAANSQQQPRHCEEPPSRRRRGNPFSFVWVLRIATGLRPSQ